MRFLKVRWEIMYYVAKLFVLAVGVFGMIFTTDFFSSNLQNNLLGTTGVMQDLKILVSHSVNGNIVTVNFSYEVGDSLGTNVIDGLSVDILFDSAIGPQLPIVGNQTAGVLFDLPTFVDLRGGKNANITFYDLNLRKNTAGNLFDFSYSLGAFSNHNVNISGKILSLADQTYELVATDYTVDVARVQTSSGGGGGGGGGGSYVVSKTSTEQKLVVKKSCSTLFTSYSSGFSSSNKSGTSSSDSPITFDAENFSWLSSLTADLLDYNSSSSTSGNVDYNNSFYFDPNYTGQYPRPYEGGYTEPYYPVPATDGTYPTTYPTEPYYPVPSTDGTYPATYPVPTYPSPYEGGYTEPYYPVPATDGTYPTTYPTEPYYPIPSTDGTYPATYPVPTYPSPYEGGYTEPYYPDRYIPPPESYYQPYDQPMTYSSYPTDGGDNSLDEFIKSLVNLNEMLEQFDVARSDKVTAKNDSIDGTAVMQDDSSKSFYCLDDSVKLEAKDKSGKKLKSVTFEPPKLVIDVKNILAPPRKTFVSDVFEVGISEGIKVSFNTAVEVFLPINAVVALKADSKLASYWLDEDTGRWNYEAPCNLSVVDDVVMCNFRTMHMTKFAIFDDVVITESVDKEIADEPSSEEVLKKEPKEAGLLQCNGVGYAQFEHPFTDIDGHFAQEAISVMFQRKIVVGYDGGVFKPDQNINRAEFLKMAMRTLNCFVVDRPSFQPFSDIDVELWYAPYVFMAKFKGIVNGYEDGQFKPANYVTRAEALKMLIYTVGAELIDGTGKLFPDVGLDAWYTDVIETAHKMSIIQGYQDGTFGPEDHLTRGQAALILFNLNCKLAMQCK